MTDYRKELVRKVITGVKGSPPIRIKEVHSVSAPTFPGVEDWVIEFTDTHGRYRLWKQAQDGGTLQEETEETLNATWGR